MGKKRGRPPIPDGTGKDVTLDARITGAEKRAFVDAADLAGLSLSSWVRERLRRAARAELNEAGKPVAFLQGDGTTKGQG